MIGYVQNLQIDKIITLAKFSKKIIVPFFSLKKKKKLIFVPSAP
jgi:hypothetical protein